MFFSPYDTTPLRKLRLTKVTDALRLAKAAGDLKNGLLESAPQIYPIVGKSAVTDSIPPFPLPIELKDNIHGDYTVVDLRPFNSKIIENQKIVDPQDGPAGLLVRMASLQTIWNNHGPETLGGIFPLPMKVFSMWAGNILARNLGFDPLQRAELITIAAWYWICLFYEEHQLVINENELARFATRISNNGLLSNTDTLKLITKCGYMADISDFVTKGIHSINTPKATRAGEATIYSTLSGSWYGSADSRTLLAVALEYPPAFISILYTAVSEIGYRKSPITETAKLFDKRDTFEEFKAKVNGVIRAYGA